jgi:hypothetical protein
MCSEIITFRLLVIVEVDKITKRKKKYMDIETLANHISGLGKRYLDNAGKIILRDVFNLNAINVDGKGDGGTDFITFTNSGEQNKVGYQITTQKSDIKGKEYRDAQKAIE